MTLVDDVKRRFLPRFVALAKQRIQNGIDLTFSTLQGEEALHLARELHSLAGEAGLLGLSHLLAIARSAEEAAAEFHARRNDEQSHALRSALSELRDAIRKIEKTIDEPTP